MDWKLQNDLHETAQKYIRKYTCANKDTFYIENWYRSISPLWKI